MFTILYIATVAAGVCVTVQQVLNAGLRSQIQSLWWTGFTSYLVGTLVMLSIALPVDGVRSAAAMIRRVHGLTWTGGVFGAIFIATAILMVPRLGAATTLALLIVGQLSAAVIIDHFGLLGIAQHLLSPVRLVGIVLLIAGAILVRV